MLISRRTAILSTGAALLAGSGGGVLANTNNVLRFVVPFAAGGPGDFSARLVAVYLAKELDMNVIVENKPGANGNIGAQQVADAPADGSIMLLNTVGMQSINPLLYPGLRYSPSRDFTTVGIVCVVPNVLVVHPEKLGVNSLAQLVALGKSKKGRLTYATFGPGSSPHIYASLLMKHAGFEAVQVPYKGSAPASTDVMAGNVDFIFDSLTTSLGGIQGHKLKGLAITSAERSPLIREVPTMKESGYPDVGLKFWLSLQINAKTPPERVEHLRAALYKVLQNPEYLAALAARGAEGMAIEPAKVHEFVLQDTARWERLGNELNIQPV